MEFKDPKELTIEEMKAELNDIKQELVEQQKAISEVKESLAAQRALIEVIRARLS